MSKQFLVFQHTEWEGPGQFFLRAAEKHAIELTIIKLWQETIPPLSPYDGLIVLGGKPNVHQENVFTYLRDEKRAIKRSIKENRPYLGICLGHQLLADALGAKVGDNYCRSHGFGKGYLTRKGKVHPLFKRIPQSFPIFKWHYQSIIEPIPRNIDILVTSVECQVEAISIKARPHIIGVQFTNNFSEVADIVTCLQAKQKWLSSCNGEHINPEVIIGDAKKYHCTLAKQYNNFFTNFVKMT